MIRAATGKPSSRNKQDELKVRPSSARGKLQSFSYTSLKDIRRPLTSKVKKTTQPTSVSSVKKVDEALPIKPQPRFERRLTVGKVDGLAKHAKTLTRLNTPSSSKIKIKIEERITLEQLNKIKTAFEEADTDGSGTLDIEEFKTVVKTCLNVTGHNEDPIVALFMKIDSSSDGEIDWDEFCTYMQLEYAEKEDSLLRSKQLHFILPAISVSILHHKSPIFRLLFIHDTTTYLCAGQDGLLTFWSANLKLRRSKSILDNAEKSTAFTVKPSVWVTDVAVLPSHGKILVATGGKEIHFYELLTFEFYCVIVGLESVPLMMDVVTLDDDQSYITFGDNQGCVSVMTFLTLGNTLKAWKKMPKVKGVPTVTLFDLANGVDTTFTRWKVHNDWVTGLRYFHELRSVISSSNEASTAVVRGSTVASTVLDHNKTPLSSSPSLSIRAEKQRKQATLAPQTHQSSDQSVFYVYKGVKAFDFCKDTNILATGGMDRIVRLWNPYVPQKPTALLRGHNSPIAFIAIAGEDRRLFTVSIDKCVKVWDLEEQDCLVTVNPKLHKISGELISCVYANSCKSIAMVTDHLSLLKISPKDGGGMPRGVALRIKQAQLAGDMPVTHSETVTCCAFNKHFNHVITSSENSVVKVWDFESGNFMFEFNKAHGNTAITALAFDTSGRRLITAGRDGAVRIWNYNNGHCLRSLERKNDDREVSSMLYIKMNKNKFIAAVGWDHRVNIFADQSDYLHHVQRPLPHWPDDLRSGHREDIVAIAYGRPNLLATCSYEGLIIVWNLVSGHSFSRLPFPRESMDSDSGSDDMDLISDGESPGDSKAVNKILFLNNRLSGKGYSSLIAGCSDGSIVFWNIHTRKAFARFINMKRSRTLSAMAVSEEGDELYVANDLGYVTAWDIEDYALRPAVQLPQGVVCPRRSQPPRRIRFWRAHIQPITCLELIDEHDVVMTSSIDHTVRMWSTKGEFIGTFGQKTPWDVYEPSTWCHPMVPPEVLVDSESLPDHSVVKDKYSISEVIHADSIEASDSDDDTAGENEKPKKSVSVSSRRRSSGGGHKAGGMSSEAWRKKLSRRLSRSTIMAGTMLKDEEQIMLEEVRRSMKSSAGKRLRQEKLLAHQRSQHVTNDVGSRAFKSLHYYELAYPLSNVSKPNPGAHLDDVFLIPEEA